MPKGIQRTPQEFAVRQHEIGQRAAELILERGFTETSVSQIAHHAGIGKSTLYDFFPTKESIVLHLVEETVRDLIQRAEDILSQEGSAEERLRRVMHMHLNFLLEDKAYYLKLTLQALRLSAESQQHYQQIRYIYQDQLQSLIESGISVGEFRAVNAAVVMKTLLAVMTPVVFTTRPEGTPAEMLDAALDIILEGIRS